ncbi:hypothetical protein [Roseivirga sp.]|uniref:hypothetical protein n=1 Tax=Roseivirga sp. TaxID=1964215 RepID=UPI003B8D7883
MLTLFLFLSALQLNAQGIEYAGTDPISLSLAGISSVLSNNWSSFNNPAGQANLENTSATLGYKTIVNFSPFNTITAALNMPTKIGVLGLSATKFGDEVFSHQQLGFSYAKRSGIMSVGLRVNLVQYQVQNFGQRSVLMAEIGGIAQLSPTFSFGAHIYNFSQSLLDKETQERIPTIIRMGFDYHPNDQLNVYFEAEKDIELPSNLKIGFAYQIIENLSLRTGISTQTRQHTFGAGLKLKRFLLDYGIRSNREIRGTHNFGLTFLFK